MKFHRSAGGPMCRQEAEWIIALREGKRHYRSHSYRALCAYVANHNPDLMKEYCDDPETIGDNQLVGQELVRDACKLLGLEML